MAVDCMSVMEGCAVVRSGAMTVDCMSAMQGRTVLRSGAMQGGAVALCEIDCCAAALS